MRSIAKLTKEELLESLDYNEKLGRFKHKGTNKRAGYTNNKGEHEILLHGTPYLEADLVWFLHTGVFPETPLAHLNGKITNNRFTNLCTTPDAKEEAKKAKLKAQADAKAAKQAAKKSKREAKQKATEKRRAIAAEKKAEEARAAYPKKIEARKRAAAATGMVQHEPTPAGLTHEALLEAVEFDEEIGRFKYRPRSSAEFNHAKFNQKYAGQLAGDERKEGYRTIFISGKRYLERDIAWFYFKGAWPAFTLVFTDGNMLNIREENLQLAGITKQTVARPLHPKSSSGHANVRWSDKTRRYTVKVTRGKAYWGGTFAEDELDLAIAAAAELRKALGFPPSHGRAPLTPRT